MLSHFSSGYALHSSEACLPNMFQFMTLPAPGLPNISLLVPPAPPLLQYSLTHHRGLVSSDICDSVISRESLWITLHGLYNLNRLNFKHIHVVFTLFHCTYMFPLIPNYSLAINKHRNATRQNAYYVCITLLKSKTIS